MWCVWEKKREEKAGTSWGDGKKAFALKKRPPVRLKATRKETKRDATPGSRNEGSAEMPSYFLRITNMPAARRKAQTASQGVWDQMGPEKSMTRKVRTGLRWIKQRYNCTDLFAAPKRKRGGGEKLGRETVTVQTPPGGSKGKKRRITGRGIERARLATSEALRPAVGSEAQWAGRERGKKGWVAKRRLYADCFARDDASPQLEKRHKKKGIRTGKESLKGSQKDVPFTGHPALVKGPKKGAHPARFCWEKGKNCEIMG